MKAMKRIQDGPGRIATAFPDGTLGTADEFLRNEPLSREFRIACGKAGVSATSRQARKWFRGIGRAAEAQRQIENALEQIAQPNCDGTACMLPSWAK